MSGLSVTLFTTTLVFMVIFIPVAFMGGTTGIFFKQFGLTMAVAVGISLINALTLSPALCALILKPASVETHDRASLQSRIRTIYTTTFNTLLKHYANTVRWFLRRKWVATIGIVVAIVLMAVLFKVVPTGFIPNEDMGTLFVDLTPPSGYTANKTFDMMNRTCDIIRELPEVQDVGGVVGVGDGANIFIQLKPWKERKGKSHSSSAIIEKIDEILSQETEAQSFVSEPGMVEGYGGSGGFEFSVQGRNGQDVRTLHEATTRFTEKLNECPEIGEVYSSYEVDYPQYRVDVDVARCKKMGVSPSTVLNEMGSYLGGNYISNFNKYNKVYQVDLQLKPSDRNRPEALANLFVRSESGEMMPINQFVTLTKEYMPQSLNSAKVRLRPILMTSLTMIIGMMPLMFASGVGANGSRTIGVCVVGGMLFGTLGLLLSVPVLFVVFQKIREKIKKGNKPIEPRL